MSVLHAAAERSVPLLVMTFVYVDPHDLVTFAQFEAIVARHGGELFPVFLQCSTEEIVRRIANTGRVARKKMASEQSVRDFVTRHQICAVPRAACLVLDKRRTTRKQMPSASSTTLISRPHRLPFLLLGFGSSFPDAPRACARRTQHCSRMDHARPRARQGTSWRAVCRQRRDCVAQSGAQCDASRSRPPGDKAGRQVDKPADKLVARCLDAHHDGAASAAPAEQAEPAAIMHSRPLSRRLGGGFEGNGTTSGSLE